MEIQKDGKFTFENAVASVSVGAGIDQDKDGVKSVEVESKMKFNLPEFLKEAGKTTDKPTLIALSAFVKEFAEKLPTIEKDILD